MNFERLLLSDKDKITEMSEMATEIVREHFDPIIGKAQNDYMIEKFQTVDAIRGQLEQGCQYYFVSEKGSRIGFLAFYPQACCMYLSKIYLYKGERGKGYFEKMLDFIIMKAQEEELTSIELNVNKNNSAVFAYEKLGFKIIRSEKNDIGEGYYMDDYVYRLEI
ncbi:MAG: GNAT family N-acetyltransferase [Saccharofermentanales bacterium]|jgi:ribosomal protein S18 acetylase RimI-like enzyme